MEIGVAQPLWPQLYVAQARTSDPGPPAARRRIAPVPVPMRHGNKGRPGYLRHVRRPDADEAVTLRSGELHYFRLVPAAWRGRLAQLVAAGMTTVSTYVPWNFHQPSSGPPDFAGATGERRDLRRFLEEVGEAGLRCILRPGPFVTAEWRNGGIPDWFLAAHPEAAARDLTGQAAGAGGPYPALTYAHPAFRVASKSWLEDVLEAVGPWLATAGGPIVEIQLDDEPSYFQQLTNPFGVDYNPYLVEPAPLPGGGDAHPASRFGCWLLERHGDLATISARYGRRLDGPDELTPPRTAPASLGDAHAALDWFAFKLSQIDDYVAFLSGIVAAHAPGIRQSVLQPYLLPLSPLRFASAAATRGLDVELTSECYLALFGAAEVTEQKVGAVVSAHDLARLWGGRRTRVLELQGSNASYLGPGALELLHGLTVARGMGGWNHYMAVGGDNPPGFEGETGRDYDLAAPIAPGGEARPHLAPIVRLNRMTAGWLEARLGDAEPCVDTHLGAYVPYEQAFLVGAGGLLGVDPLAETFDPGLLGLSGANSLPALLALSGVSAGAVDLESLEPEQLAGLSQLILPGGRFLARRVQELLVEYVRGGGDLVVLPALPELDEDFAPCRILAEHCLGELAGPDGPPVAARLVSLRRSEAPSDPDPGESPARRTRPEGRVWAGARTDPAAPAGTTATAGTTGTLRTRGSVQPFALAPDAMPLAWLADGRPVACSRRVGAGRVTVLGFGLGYTPTGGTDQFDFVRDLLHPGHERVAVASERPAVAFLRDGPAGGVLCLANPVDLPVRTRVSARDRDGVRHVFPVLSGGLDLDGRGALLLPFAVPLAGGARLVYATTELVSLHTARGGAVATFTLAAARARRASRRDASDTVEIGLSGIELGAGRGAPAGPARLELRGATELGRATHGEVTSLLLGPRSDRFEVVVQPSHAGPVRSPEEPRRSHE